MTNHHEYEIEMSREEKERHLETLEIITKEHNRGKLPWNYDKIKTADERIDFLEGRISYNPANLEIEIKC